MKKEQKKEIVFEDWTQKERKNVMDGKEGWTFFMAINGVKMYSNGKEIRNEYGDKQF